MTWKAVASCQGSLQRHYYGRFQRSETLIHTPTYYTHYGKGSLAGPPMHTNSHMALLKLASDCAGMPRSAAGLGGPGHLSAKLPWAWGSPRP